MPIDFMGPGERRLNLPFTPEWFEQSRIQLQNPIDEVVAPVLRGVARGLTTLKEICDHPVDNLLYPMSLLAWDALVMAGTAPQMHEDPELRAWAADMNRMPGVAADARARMVARFEAIDTAITNYQHASPRDQKEMAAQFLTETMVPGKMLRLARGLVLKETVGSFNPVAYKYRYPELLMSIYEHPEVFNPLFVPMKQVRQKPGTYSYVVLQDGSRLYSRYGHHGDMARGRDVLAAGEVISIPAENGRPCPVVEANNKSGGYPNLIDEPLLKRTVGQDFEELVKVPGIILERYDVDAARQSNMRTVTPGRRTAAIAGTAPAAIHASTPDPSAGDYEALLADMASRTNGDALVASYEDVIQDISSRLAPKAPANAVAINTQRSMEARRPSRGPHAADATNAATQALIRRDLAAIREARAEAAALTEHVESRPVPFDKNGTLRVFSEGSARLSDALSRASAQASAAGDHGEAAVLGTFADAAGMASGAAAMLSATGPVGFSLAAFTLVASTASMLLRSRSGPSPQMLADIRTIRDEQRTFHAEVNGALSLLRSQMEMLAKMTLEGLHRQEDVRNAIWHTHRAVDSVHGSLRDQFEAHSQFQYTALSQRGTAAMNLLRDYTLGPGTMLHQISTVDDALRATLNLLEHEIYLPAMTDLSTPNMDPRQAAIVLRRHQNHQVTKPGFLAARMHAYLGDQVPLAFLNLAELNIFGRLLDTHLLATQQSLHPSGDGCRSLCDALLAKLALYQEFADYLRDNPAVIRTQQDLRDHHASVLGRYQHANRYCQMSFDIESLPSKHAVDEIDLILDHLQCWSKAITLRQPEQALRNLQDGHVSLCAAIWFDHCGPEHKPGAHKQAVNLMYANFVLEGVGGELDRKFKLDWQAWITPHAFHSGQCGGSKRATYHTPAMMLLYLAASRADANTMAPWDASPGYAGIRDMFRTQGLPELWDIDPAQEAAARANCERYKRAFDYHGLVTQGRLPEADKLHAAQAVDLDALLFITSIVGRVDVLERCMRDMPHTLDCSATLPGCLLTPLMLAAEHGREDVVDFLLALGPEACGLDKRSFWDKTASDIARAEGFDAIALKIDTAATLAPGEMQVGARPAVALSECERAVNWLTERVQAYRTHLPTVLPTQPRPTGASPAPRQTGSPTAELTDEEALDYISTALKHAFPDRDLAWTKPQGAAAGQRELPLAEQSLDFRKRLKLVQALKEGCESVEVLQKDQRPQAIKVQLPLARTLST